MLSQETVLRQRYSLSFLTTTLLIALTTQSSLAFSINPPEPAGATVQWVPTESYFLANPSRQGITKLNPPTVERIPRGGTTDFLEILRMDFPHWTFNSAAKDLAGSFNVKIYAAVGKPIEVGADFALEYIPGDGDPIPLGRSLHWIQRVRDNHNARVDVHSLTEDIIDIGPGVTDPFYDTLGTASETIFLDRPRRPDPFNDHDWIAELYLVEQTEPRKVTIYNGIEWGWENNVVEPVPEPVTIFGSGMGLGLGVLFKKKLQGSRRKQKVSKS